MKHAILIAIEDGYFNPTRQNSEHVFNLKNFLSENFGCLIKGDQDKFFNAFMPCLKTQFEYHMYDVLVFEASENLICTFEENDINMSIVGNTWQCDDEYRLLPFDAYYEENELYNVISDPTQSRTDEFKSMYDDYINSEINETIKSILKLWKKY